MWKEFRAFLARGNVIDLAVAVVIGGAFGAIVKSFVDDVIMPPIGLLTGRIDFKDQFLVLRDGAATAGPYLTLADAKAAGAVTLNYGAFINNVITFLIVAAAIFVIVRAVNRLYRQPAPATPETKPCPYCTMTVSLQATRCPHCTSELARAIPAAV